VEDASNQLMCDIADTVEDVVAHDSKVAVILLTETHTACG
jgi:hypothetical protein